MRSCSRPDGSRYERKRWPAANLWTVIAFVEANVHPACTARSRKSQSAGARGRPARAIRRCVRRRRGGAQTRTAGRIRATRRADRRTFRSGCRNAIQAVRGRRRRSPRSPDRAPPRRRPAGRDDAATTRRRGRDRRRACRATGGCPRRSGPTARPSSARSSVQRTASPKCVARTSPVASVQPSPTTMISSARRVCRSAERTAGTIHAAAL